MEPHAVGGSSGYVYLPTGGALDLSPPAPDVYAPLVGPQSTSWWNSKAVLSNKQIVAADIAHKIDVLRGLATAKNAESRALDTSYRSALVDAQVAPYGEAARYQKAMDLHSASLRATNAAASAGAVADALQSKFGALGLGDTQFGMIGVGTADDYRDSTYASGLDGATALGRALARRGPGSAVSDFTPFDVAITLLTWGEAPAITRLMSLSLPRLGAEEAGVIALDEVAPGLAARGRYPLPGPNWSSSLAAGTGETDAFGNMTVSSLGSQLERDQALFHEQVHSFLSPAPDAVLAVPRATAGAWLYENSTLMRFTEEAIAESRAQILTRGVTGLTLREAVEAGVRFPFENGYNIGVLRLGAEGAGAAAAIYGGYRLGDSLYGK